MYTRLSAILFPLTLVALIGAGVWGYQENQEKNAILIKAENQYQRNFHDLSYHMDKLHTELGNTLAAGGDAGDYHRKGLVNVWRLTSQAQNEISALPLTLLPFTKTEAFLDQINKFTYRTSVRDLTKNPLSDEEMKALQTLYERSSDITKELRGVQAKVMANNLRWMDVEVALASQKENQDNVIIDGFRTMDKSVGQFPELNYGPTMMNVMQKRSLQTLGGADISADDAKTKAAKFLDLADPSGLAVVENGGGTEYNTYSVSGKAANTDVQLDYAKKGGQLVFFMSLRQVGGKTVDTRAARDAAAEFLDKHGYASMTLVSADEYQNVASLTFAGKSKDTIIYPEKVVVKVALDNGDIIGLQATDYLFEHKERTWPAPTLTLEQAKKELNPGFQVSGSEMAIIKNDLDEEVLCYQFTGKMNNANYRIFLNANTGLEEKIETV
ncbi:germination protein YpeB [Paenibacillus cymbidii]|uniref:germination protein YpeB n=1 Tax=Paenibacillus cymbidii TaxID=1639034 RepID=UPI0010814B99|nr:germination protein YpeB [Paenibacillus cymbidii]